MLTREFRVSKKATNRQNKLFCRAENAPFAQGNLWRRGRKEKAMENRTVSKKVPIILAICWVVISMAVLWYTMPKMIHLEGVFADWNIQMLVFFAVQIFSIGMMTAIRILSKKAKIRWMAVVSKILLIFYSVVGGLGLIAFIVIHLTIM